MSDWNRRLEQLISETPSGELRNELTAINLLMMQQIEDYKEVVKTLKQATVNPQLDWAGCEKHFNYVAKVYRDLIGTPGVNVSFALYNVIEPLERRFLSGERTESLFNEMMEVE